MGKLIKRVFVSLLGKTITVGVWWLLSYVFKVDLNDLHEGGKKSGK